MKVIKFFVWLFIAVVIETYFLFAISWRDAEADCIKYERDIEVRDRLINRLISDYEDFGDVTAESDEWEDYLRIINK